MATNHTTIRPKYRFIIITFAVLTLAGVGALAYTTTPTAGQADTSLDALTVDDVNETISGNVSDVQVNASIDYDWSVPDASRVLITLMVGLSRDEMETVTFHNIDSPGGQGFGTVELAGSATETDVFSASDFDPEIAGNETTEMVVAVGIEVRRSGGDAVSDVAYENVTVYLEDGTSLSASVSGAGGVSVVTE